MSSQRIRRETSNGLQKQGFECPLVGGQSNKRPREDQLNAIQDEALKSNQDLYSWEPIRLRGSEQI